MPAKTATASFRTVPLTDNEKDLLGTIYRKRVRFFVPVYAVLLFWGAFYSGYGLDVRSRYSDKWHHWEEEEDAQYISRTQMHWIGFAFLELIVVGSGLLIYFKRIDGYRKDIKCGMKEMVPYRIVRKEYFPITGQYFVALDDPDYLHHEIDAGTYSQCHEGDDMYLARTIHAKYVFEMNGRFTLM